MEAAIRLEGRLGELAGVVRRLSHRMHPPDLRADLADSIRSWCAELRRTERLDVRCVTASLPVALPADVALCLYRIAQEALRNVIKHAHVGRASLRLSFENERVHLVVSDRGNGFEVPRRRRNGGLGLVTMEERVRILGGRFEIRSAPDRGTTVRASVPVSNA
jgi:two-component system sensor histidine kinase UhpB